MLTGDSPMPFGMHKDSLMSDVPARYLMFIWDVKDGLWLDGPFLGRKQREVREYIVENFFTLERASGRNIKHKPDGHSS